MPDALTRVLHLDVSRGASALDIFGALVDVGVAPSPILHALSTLPAPAHVLIEDAGHGVAARTEPPEAPMLVRMRDLRATFARTTMPASAVMLAADALERLYAATAPRVEGACVLQHTLDASQVMGISAAAMAVRALDPAVVTCSRVPVDDDPAPAFVDMLGNVADALDFGAPRSVTDDAAALLRALVDDAAFGRSEPAWSGVVSRGESGSGVRAFLGEA